MAKQLDKNLRFVIISASTIVLNVVGTTLRDLGIVHVAKASSLTKIQHIFGFSSVNMIIADYQLFQKHESEIIVSMTRHRIKAPIVLLCSETISPQKLKEMYQLGVGAHLEFPFQIESLIQSIKDALRIEPAKTTVKSNILGKIKEIDFFSFLSDKELLKLMQMGKIRRYPCNDMIFEEGQSGDRFYVIIQGQVTIAKHAGASDVDLAILEKGVCFGEMAILDLSPRMASAKATSDTILFELSGKIMEGYDDMITLKIFKKLAFVFSKRLRDASIKIKELTLYKTGNATQSKNDS